MAISQNGSETKKALTMCNRTAADEYNQTFKKYISSIHWKHRNFYLVCLEFESTTET